MTVKEKNNIIEEATKMYLRYDYKNLLEYLNSCKKQFQIDSKRENKKFNHLLALTYAFENNLTDAEKLCNQAIEVEPKEIDYYFVLSYVHLKLREHEKVLKFSKLYLEYQQKKKIAYLSLTFSNQYKCQIFSFIGTAYTELSDYKKATTHYLKAIKTEKENHLPYIQLVNLYLHVNEFNKAEKLIQKGIKVCSQIQELRLLEKSLEITQQETSLNQVKFDENLLEIDKLNADSQEFATLTILADTYKNEEKFEKALQLYEILLHIEPNNERLLLTLSDCYLLMGHEDSAVIGFERVLALVPGHKYAQEQLERYKKPIFSH